MNTLRQPYGVGVLTLCREMMSCCQDRVLSNTAKLQADLREYMNKQTATIEAGRVCRRFEDKLTVSDQKARSKGKDPTTSQRYLRSQKEFEAVSFLA
ncbi:hypothetical protein X801_06669 [Opisthorchis viverrini]|uniref:Uncharacterized protein n=1 Tax=Opisthorchis viverrini TaxID=6198 RepID=A0A1S8WSY6_OPIVI|nr:hypothetical protein X801_06669 [Opisthorchis viverrini]